MILFFDIDGTLVSFKTHSIPHSAVEAIAKAHSAGHKVVIATGRPGAIINNLGQLQSRGLIDAFITMNGAYCHANGKVLSSTQIPHSDVATLARFCEDNGFPCIFVNQTEMHIAGADLEAVSIFAKQLNAPDIPTSDYHVPTLSPIFQLTPFFSDEVQKEIEPLMPGSEFARWHPAFVDITAKGCTKAAGIDAVIREFGLDLSQTIAFGDGGNDIPMLRHAAIGVAMGNADPDVKKAADYVTASVDDDGIARAISDLLKL